MSPFTKGLFLLAIILLYSCREWEYQRISFLEVITGEAAELTANTAVLKGTIFGLIKEETVSQHGHLWSAQTETPTLEDHEGKTALGRQGDISFFSTATSLKSLTRYFYRTYAVFQEQPVYGEVMSFTTRNFSVAVDTKDGISVEKNCATITWQVISYLGDPERLGVVCSPINEVPALNTAEVMQTEQSAPYLNCGASPCPITEELCDLAPNTNYYLRPYLIPGKDQDPVYGEVVSFHTFPPGTGWDRRKDYPGEPLGHPFYSFSAGGRLFTGGDLPWDNWENNPATDTWEQMRSKPGSFSGLASLFAIPIGEKLYFNIQDIPSSPSYDNAHLWEYDPLLGMGTWKAVVNITNPLFDRLILELTVTFSIGGKGYLVVGAEGKNAALLSLNPNSRNFPDTIIPLSIDVGLPVSQPPFHWYPRPDRNLVVDNRAFILSRAQSWEIDLEDPAQPRIRSLDAFPEYAASVAFAIRGKIYAGLGRAAEVPDGPTTVVSRRHFWEFDPGRASGSQWRRMPDFPPMDRPETILQIDNEPTALQIPLYWRITPLTYADFKNSFMVDYDPVGPQGFSDRSHGYVFRFSYRLPDEIQGDPFFSDRRVWRFTPPD